MKTFFSLVLFVIFATQCLAQNDYVVRVIAEDPDNHKKPVEERGRWLGSGVLIQTDLVLTNQHVVDNIKTKVTVNFFYKTEDFFQEPAKILKIDRDVDLALLKINPVKIQTVYIARQNPSLRETICIHGYADSENYREISGPIIAGSSFDNGPFIMFVTRGCVIGGMSGGPALNSQNQLVGLVWGARKSSNSNISEAWRLENGTSYSIDARTIRTFLKNTEFMD